MCIYIYIKGKMIPDTTYKRCVENGIWSFPRFFNKEKRKGYLDGRLP